MKIEVLYEHADFILVDKPEGLSFHSEAGEGVVVKLQKQLGIKQLYSVHRLDKMTSGLLLLAKNASAARKLTQLFEQRLIQKYYLAISTRKPKKKQGLVKGDMALSRRGSYKLLKSTRNPALTRFVSAAGEVHERYFLIKPYTGKTHQIRVALKSIGAPVAGDRRYSALEEAKKEQRGYLHAYALRFEYEKRAYTFVCQPKGAQRYNTQKFHEQLRQWSKPWEYFKESK